MPTLQGKTLKDRFAVSATTLGSGGGSIVYQGFDLHTSERVAVKLVTGEEAPAFLQEFFRRETTALRKLRHRNIIRLLDSGIDEGVGSWLVLEYAPGGSLRDAHVRARYTDPPSIVRLLADCAAALAHAHVTGVVHRDIKPSNVLFDAEFVPKLADFNVSRVAGMLRDTSGATVRHHYTPRYAAPERETEAATERSDVYSLGAVAAELLLGDAGVPADELRTRVQALAGAGPLRDVVARMLDPDPAARPTAPQLVAELEVVAERFEPLHALNLRLTRSAVARVVAESPGEQGGEERAPALVRRDLGAPLRASPDPPSQGSYKLLGARFRYYVKPETRADGCGELVVTNVVPLHDAERARADALRLPAEAQVVGPGAPPVPGRSGVLLEELYGAARAAWEAGRARNQARRTLLARWETYLDIARRIQERDETLGVVRRVVARPEIDGFEVELDRPVTGGSIAQRPVCHRAGEGKPVPLGVVVGYDGERVRVAADPNLPPGSVPPPGATLAFDARREMANLRRQREALQKVQMDAAVRPGLFALLAAPGEIEPAGPGNTDLPPVERALAANPFFLIQGPPGTGKTTLIAQLVAEIRRRYPQERILVASQSNIAVDNVLERLGGHLAPDAMVRLGNPEKISGGVRALELKTRLAREQEVLRAAAEEARERFARLMRVPAAEISTLLEQLSGAGGEEAEAAAELAREMLGDTIPPEPESLRAHLQALLRLRGKAAAGIEAIGEIQREWMERLQGASPDLERHLLRSTPVVAGTCIGFIGNRTAGELQYPWVIVDEAGRATPPELLVPLSRGQRFVLVGDHRQLPPIVDDEVAREVGKEIGVMPEELARSLFEELYEGVVPGARMRLEMQYRMHPRIGDLVSRVFYEGALRTGVDAGERAFGTEVFGAPVRWLDAPGSASGGQETRVGTSFVNHAEARVLAEDLRVLVRRLEELGIRATIGVLAGYAPQVQLLRDQLDAHSGEGVEVLTVDAAQGKEFDFVYYSAVRSNPAGELGFLSDERRLNVALSRARHCLTIVGDAGALRTARSRRGANPFRTVHDLVAAGGGIVPAAGEAP